MLFDEEFVLTKKLYCRPENEIRVEKFFESCGFKTVLSGAVGFGLGIAVGLFTASVGPELAPVNNQTQTVKEVLREMKGKSMSYAKNFAMLGAMFSATECAIESVRLRWAFGDFTNIELFVPVSGDT